MATRLPILDRKPTRMGGHWRYAALAVPVTRSTAFKNRYVNGTAPRDQDARGTCVGQSTAYCFDLEYMMVLGDVPTDADRAAFKKDVVDALGTRHDVLYPQSASAECFYTTSRRIGNVTYPAGSEIFFAVQAWQKYGMNTETQWHTDKDGTYVWATPMPQANGGLDEVAAAAFAADHRIVGYAQVGSATGTPTWDEVCDAIFTKGFALGAIPVYENYASMQGGDGTFPDPRGSICGYHALCFYGYDEQWLYFLHSWGDWCGRYGKISKTYFQSATGDMQFFTVLDDAEVAIGRQMYRGVHITCSVQAAVTLDGKQIGVTPCTIALQNGSTYQLVLSAEGYMSKTCTVNDGMTTLSVVLETGAPVVTINRWWTPIVNWILKLLGRK